jgi:hypothetical protein
MGVPLKPLFSPERIEHQRYAPWPPSLAEATYGSGCAADSAPSPPSPPPGVVAALAAMGPAAPRTAAIGAAAPSAASAASRVGSGFHAPRHFVRGPITNGFRRFRFSIILERIFTPHSLGFSVPDKVEYE